MILHLANTLPVPLRYDNYGSD